MSNSPIISTQKGDQGDPGADSTVPGPQGPQGDTGPAGDQAFRNLLPNGEFLIKSRGSGTTVANEYTQDCVMVSGGIAWNNEQDLDEDTWVMTLFNDAGSTVYTRLPIELGVVGGDNFFQTGNTYTISGRSYLTVGTSVTLHAAYRDTAADNLNFVEDISFANRVTILAAVGADGWYDWSYTHVITADAAATNAAYVPSIGYEGFAPGVTTKHNWIQLEEGISFTGLEVRPFGVYNAICQRYVQRFRNTSYKPWFGRGNGAGQIDTDIITCTRMRQAPTIEFPDTAADRWAKRLDGSTATLLEDSVVTGIGDSVSGFFLNWAPPVAAVSNAAYMLYFTIGVTYIATAEI